MGQMKQVKRSRFGTNFFFVTDLSLVGKANGVSIDPCGKGYYFHAPLNPASQKTLRTFSSPITAQFQKYFFSNATSTSPFDPDTPISPIKNDARIEKSQIFAHRESSIQIFVTQPFNNCFTHQQSWVLNELRFWKYYRDL